MTGHNSVTTKKEG